jgi:serine-type D-Ala-D-Ala carboxypeptidase (penicillin-binding protein 5/6)
LKKAVPKILAVLIAICCAFGYNVKETRAEVGVSAKSAILIEATTGRILFEQNANEKKPMASTTKVMTALLALESCDLDETVVVSENASGVGGSSIWLSVGEHMCMSDMLFGLMLSSGNDAAVAIAEHVAGSVDEFVAMMNAKAKEIGAYNTNFVNPNGLPADGHYTTAYDLSLICAYAMRNPYFCEIVKTQYKTIPWEGHEWDRVVKNKNKLLWNYEGGNGIKTGYTDAAGKCLCAAAQRDGMQLITVVLDAPDMFNDCTRLLDYGFENYEYRTLVSSGEFMGDVNVAHGMEDGFKVYTQQDVAYPLTEEEYGRVQKKVYIEGTVDAPITEGQLVGTIDIWLDGKRVYSANLTAPREIGDNSYIYNLRKLLELWINPAA